MMEKKTIEQAIEQEGKFVSTTSGFSMYPLLYDRRDTIIILPKNGRLKKYDVPLYRRGDAYVLHRIVKVLPDSYVICGDNCECYEYGIRDEDIIGYLAAFYRKDKYCTVDNRVYRFYSFVMVHTHHIRVFYKRARRFAAKIYRKIFPKK